MRARHFFLIAFLTSVTCARVGLLQAPHASGSESVAETQTKPGVAHKKLKGVRNFGEVTPQLYRGAEPTKAGLEALAKMGIDIIVDVGSNKRERQEATRLGMHYVSIPWHCYHKRDEVFARFLRLVRENPDKKVFIHCRFGDDRTGMMIATFRIAEQGWTAEAARKEMQAYGFTAIHHIMCPGLGAYESSFPQRFRTSPAFQSLRRPK